MNIADSVAESFSITNSNSKLPCNLFWEFAQSLPTGQGLVNLAN